MTILDTAKITCPECAHEDQMTIWSTLNVTLDRELKHRVLDHSLFRFKCKHCNAEAPVFFRCLYHDMEAHAMIWLIEKDASIEEFKGALGAIKLALQPYRLRVVRSVNDLVEIVRLLDCGLNDIAVQIVKYGVAQSEGAQEGPWYFIGVEPAEGDSNERMIGFSSPNAGCSCKVPIGKDFDELSESLAPFVCADSCLEVTPEKALLILGEALGPEICQ